MLERTGHLDDDKRETASNQDYAAGFLDGLAHALQANDKNQASCGPESTNGLAGWAAVQEEPWDPLSYPTQEPQLGLDTTFLTVVTGPDRVETRSVTAVLPTTLSELEVDDQSSTINALRVRRPKKATTSAAVTKHLRGGAVQTVFRAHGTNRSRFDEAARVRTAFTRGVGACETCRKRKLRCDQSSNEKFLPCQRCARIPSYLLPTPCCRVELIDIKLFRSGEDQAVFGPWLQAMERGKGQLLLPDGTVGVEPPRRVRLTQDVNLSSFEVTLSRYLPGPNDATSYFWKDAAGNKGEVALPPYYISDMDEAQKNMRQYFISARSEFPRALLVNSNPIVQRTFAEAERYYNTAKSLKRNLVTVALMFWSATRMIERWWLVCGNDLLGMPPMDHDMGPCRRNPYMAAIPVTPVMDTQLDEIAMRGVIIPLKNKLLAMLKQKMLAKKKEDWFEIYLTSFIVLHNSERVLSHVVDFSRRFGVNPTNRSNSETSLSHAYYHACKTILVYFHFAAGGATPLSLGWSGPNQDPPPMTNEQMEYLDAIKAEMLSQDVSLQNLKSASMYETELYWCHQMLFPNWKADSPHSGTFLEFVDKDFLVT